MADEITIKVDQFHLKLISCVIGIMVLVAGGVQAMDLWRLQKAYDRDVEIRRRMSFVEGQVKAISEAIQHEP